MRFSTDDPCADIIKSAISWLDRGYRPVVIYPANYPRRGRNEHGSVIVVPTSGKEPFGREWGLKPISAQTLTKDIHSFLPSGMVPGLGLCLGPGRAPENLGLMDIEGDGPEAEESRKKLLGCEQIPTVGHISVRGIHQFFSYDWDRLREILEKLTNFQKGGQPGVYHLPGLPGLELRIGGVNDQGKLKQLQTVIPPTPGTNGQPRQSNGILTLAPAPESFYHYLLERGDDPGPDLTSEIPDKPGPEPEPESEPEPVRSDDPGKKPDPESETTRKRGRPKGSGVVKNPVDPVASAIKNTSKTGKGKGKGRIQAVGNSITDWLLRQFHKSLSDVEEAAEGERHATLMRKMTWLAGYLHYGCGFTGDELERAGIQAANKAAPNRKGDNPRCVREAINHGKTLPAKLPDRLHEKYTRFQKAIGPVLPKSSVNGTGSGPKLRQPGDDDPGLPPGFAAGGGPLYNLTDMGNASRLIDLHGIDLCYVGLWKSWYLWAGDRWVKDDDGTIYYRCQDVIKLLRREAAALGPDDGEETALWSITSESAYRLDSIERIARCNPSIISKPEDFDSNPWYLNCTNGTIDLKTGRLGPHVRSDKILKTTGTAYDPAATCPTWIDFLMEIFDGNHLLIDYVQKLVGYSSVGVTNHHILVFLSGDGSNGKSTLLEVINDTLGGEHGYSGTCDHDLLVENKFSTDQQQKLANLFGKRFVYTVEMKDGANLAEGMVKRITGGDTIKARRIYEHPFDFQPTHTVWLAANQAPDIQGRDLGIWRRIKRIPFDVTIPDDRVDPRLREKLNLERSGILRWIVEGVSKWLQYGLAEPQAVKDAIQEYKDSTDVYGPFFEDYCETGPTLKCITNDLYKEFTHWCHISNVNYININKFSRILTSRGYGKDRVAKLRLTLGIKPNGSLEQLKNESETAYRAP
jgi:putative DNA primase/helicase